MQLTTESEPIDSLGNGDKILADKGIPDYQIIIHNSGKKVMLLMLPLPENKSEFSKEETKQTYNIARVRIHVECIMQRLRIYQILSNIPEHSFRSIDDKIQCAVY